MQNKMVYDDSYFQKTYAGWLGKIIGIRLGSPIEGWTYEQIEKVHGEITDYLVDYKDFAADDDSNGPLFFIRALIDYSYDIENITPREMGLTWLNYVAEKHGFFWWGGYGISTEHTAFDNLKYGIDAPESGSIELNGAACAEQIGGQIFSDSWGFIAAGQPELAAQYAGKMASVSHDGEGIYGGRFVAACVSAAYLLDDIRKIIEVGLALIPKDCEYATISRDIIRFYDNDQNKDWRKCFAYIKANYGYDKYPGNCHIIPNSAVMILSMLYGEGDYTTTQCICNMCGWDTDCNAGNVGAILGVMVGIDGIDDKWINPVNDLLISSSVIGGLNISTVSKTTELFCEIGLKVAGIQAPDKWRKPMGSEASYFHFDFEKSTQAMRIIADRPDVEAAIQNTEGGRNGHRALKITANRMNTASEIRVFAKTYYRPADLHDSRYDPAFTPVVFPGQIIKTVLRNDTDSEVRVMLYAKDLNNEEHYWSERFVLNRNWNEICFKIPEVDGGLIGEVGIILSKNAPENKKQEVLMVLMDHLEISGSPNYNINFSKERIEDYGFGHGGLHRDVSQFTFLNGLWELDGEYLSGSCNREGEAYTGHYQSVDNVIRCVLNPQSGFNHLVNFRVQGGARSYAFGFKGKNTVALLKKDRDYQTMISTKFNFEHKIDYEFKISVRGHHFSLSIDGDEILSIEDDECKYEYGQVGFAVLDGSHCHFRDLRISPS